MSADSFLAGGNPSAKFPSIGTKVEGRIIRVGNEMQQRDFKTKEPKFFKNGDPQMQLPVDVQTDLRDPEIQNDHGVRTIYIKGELRKAFRKACRAAGVPGLREDGFVSVTYSANGQVTDGFAPKLFTVVYTPPVQAAEPVGQAYSGDEDDYVPAAAAVPAQAQSVAPQPETAGVGQRPW